MPVYSHHNRHRNNILYVPIYSSKLSKINFKIQLLMVKFNKCCLVFCVKFTCWDYWCLGTNMSVVKDSNIQPHHVLVWLSLFTNKYYFIWLFKHFCLAPQIWWFKLLFLSQSALDLLHFLPNLFSFWDDILYFIVNR